MGQSTMRSLKFQAETAQQSHIRNTCEYLNINTILDCFCVLPGHIA